MPELAAMEADRAADEARVKRALVLLDYLEKYAPHTLRYYEVLMPIRRKPLEYGMDADTEVFIVNGVLSDVPF